MSVGLEPANARASRRATSKDGCLATSSCFWMAKKTSFWNTERFWLYNITIE